MLRTSHAGEHISPSAIPPSVGVDEVVERGLIRFAGNAPANCCRGAVRPADSEIHAVEAASGEVVVALVRVAIWLTAKSSRSIPTPLHVRPPGLRRDLGRVLSANQVRELVYAVDRGGTGGLSRCGAAGNPGTRDRHREAAALLEAESPVVAVFRPEPRHPRATRLCRLSRWGHPVTTAPVRRDLHREQRRRR